MLRGFAARVLAASLLFWSCAALATNYPIGTTPTLIITSGDMSQASIVSDAIPVFGLDNFGIQCIWNSTPTGTFYFLVGFTTDTSTFNTATLSPVPAASGASGSFTLDVNQSSPPYFAIKYVKTGGTGTVNCKAYGKKV